MQEKWPCRSVINDLFHPESRFLTSIFPPGTTAPDGSFKTPAMRPVARGLEKARAHGFPAVCIPSKGVPREEYDHKLVAELKAHEVELVCLAGYMRLLSPAFIREFPMRVLNIHPSLLPSFPGLDAQEQALKHGVKVSGCTVHFVDEDLDAGPIILQAAVPVLDDDDVETLSARILKEEHRIYSEAIRIVLAGKYRIAGRRVLMA